MLTLWSALKTKLKVHTPKFTLDQLGEFCYKENPMSLKLNGAFT